MLFLFFTLKCKISSSGLTGHAEVVRVVFSPKDISLEKLLQYFWENHDPTQGSSMRTHTHTHTHCKVTLKQDFCPKGHKRVLEQKDDAHACACVHVVVGGGLMGVSQRQTVLMCLRSSHPWRDTPL